MSSLANDLVRQLARLNSQRAAPGQANRWQGRLNDGKRLHAIDPEGETRSDDIVLDEIRLVAGEP
jgi:hypothetical protein